MKTIRSFLIICLVLLLAVPLLTAPVSAGDVYISFSDPTALIGQTVTVSVASSVPVAGLTLSLVYDADYLKYTGFTGGLGNAAVNDTGGALTIVDYDSGSQSALLLNLSFQPLKLGSTALTVSSCSVSDAGGDIMNAAWGSSAVNITSASSDASLRALELAPGTLSPAFDPSVTEYSASVSADTTWLAVTARPADSSAQAFVEGHSSLKPGDNTVTVTVTAGDGSKKLYTVRVTRGTAAAPTAAPSAPPTVTTVPSTAGKLFARVTDGGRVEIGSFTPAQIPAGYTAVTVSYFGQELDAVQSADGSRIAVWLAGSAAVPAGFYYFDASTGTATPMDELIVAGRSYTVMDAALSGENAPEDCSLARYTLGTGSYNVYQPKTPGAQYIIFYGSCNGGAPALYRYDMLEQTAQRYSISVTGSPEPESAEPAEPFPDPELLAQVSELQTRSLILRRTAAAAGIFAAVFFILAVVLGVLLDRKNREMNPDR